MVATARSSIVSGPNRKEGERIMASITTCDVFNPGAVAVSVGSTSVAAYSVATVSLAAGLDAAANASKRNDLQNHLRHGRLQVVAAS